MNDRIELSPEEIFRAYVESVLREIERRHEHISASVPRGTYAGLDSWSKEDREWRAHELRLVHQKGSECGLTRSESAGIIADVYVNLKKSD